MNIEENPVCHQPEPYISKAEVAKRVGKTLRTVDVWMRRGVIPYFKIRHSVLFKWSDVEAHLAANYRVSKRGGLPSGRMENQDLASPGRTTSR